MPTSTAAPTRVKVGMTFRSSVADSNPLWKVLSRDGQQGWLCECVNEPFELDGVSYDSDYAGARRIFGANEILASARMAHVFASLHNEHDRFWANVPIGTVLHYDNGFEQYVRGVVVEEGGERKLRPTAIVGNVIPINATVEQRLERGWHAYDLVKREAWGAVTYGYHVRKIMEGAAWQPNIGCVVEAPGYDPSGRRKVDPRTLDPVDIDALLDEPDREQLAEEAANRLLNRVHKMCFAHDLGDHRQRVAIIRELLNKEGA